MKMKELREKSAQELLRLLTEGRSKLRRERFNQSGSRSKNVKFSGSQKKEIAKILTLIREREKHGTK